MLSSKLEAQSCWEKMIWGCARPIALKGLFERVLSGFQRIAALAAVLVLASAGGALGGEYFRVDMVKPQHFIIETLVPGPVATSSQGPQTQIKLRQQHGRTIVHALVPPGGELQVKVGSHRLRLRMVDEERYQVEEE